MDLCDQNIDNCRIKSKHSSKNPRMKRVKEKNWEPDLTRRLPNLMDILDEKRQLLSDINGLKTEISVLQRTYKQQIYKSESCLLSNHQIQKNPDYKYSDKVIMLENVLETTNNEYSISKRTFSDDLKDSLCEEIQQQRSHIFSNERILKKMKHELSKLQNKIAKVYEDSNIEIVETQNIVIEDLTEELSRLKNQENQLDEKHKNLVTCNINSTYDSFEYADLCEQYEKAKYYHTKKIIERKNLEKRYQQDYEKALRRHNEVIAEMNAKAERERFRNRMKSRVSTSKISRRESMAIEFIENERKSKLQSRFVVEISEEDLQDKILGKELVLILPEEERKLQNISSENKRPKSQNDAKTNSPAKENIQNKVIEENTQKEIKASEISPNQDDDKSQNDVEQISTNANDGKQNENINKEKENEIVIDDDSSSEQIIISDAKVDDQTKDLTKNNEKENMSKDIIADEKEEVTIHDKKEGPSKDIIVDEKEVVTKSAQDKIEDEKNADKESMNKDIISDEKKEEDSKVEKETKNEDTISDEIDHNDKENSTLKNMIDQKPSDINIKEINQQTNNKNDQNEKDKELAIKESSQNEINKTDENSNNQSINDDKQKDIQSKQSYDQTDNNLSQNEKPKDDNNHKQNEIAANEQIDKSQVASRDVPSTLKLGESVDHESSNKNSIANDEKKQLDNQANESQQKGDSHEEQTNESNKDESDKTTTQNAPKKHRKKLKKGKKSVVKKEEAMNETDDTNNEQKMDLNEKNQQKEANDNKNSDKTVEIKSSDNNGPGDVLIALLSSDHESSSSITSQNDSNSRRDENFDTSNEDGSQKSNRVNFVELGGLGKPSKLRRKNTKAKVVYQISFNDDFNDSIDFK